MKAREILQTLFDEFRETGAEITSDHDSKTAPLKGGVGIITLVEPEDPYLPIVLGVRVQQEKIFSLVKRFLDYENLVACLNINGLDLRDTISTTVTAILTRATELVPQKTVLHFWNS